MKTKITNFLFLGVVLISFNSNAQSNAINLDGVNDYIQTPVVNNSPNITYECWAKGGHAVTEANGFNGPMYGGNFAIVWDHTSSIYSGAASVGAANGTFIAAGFGELLADTWYHLAATYDGTTLKAYKNGILRSSVTTAGGLLTDNATLKMGCHPTLSNYFEGSIDAVRVWNTARTECEIRANMNTEITTAQAGLIANYNFSQGIANSSNTSINTLTDLSGNSNTATPTNFGMTNSISNFTNNASFNLPVTGFKEQPAGSTTKCENDYFDLPLNATNSFATFQWVKDEANIDGFTSQSLYIPAVTLADAGTYILALTDACGTYYSNSAVLVVNPVPVPTITVVGDELTSTITGTSYQWYFNNGIIADATNQSYTVTEVGNYTVHVTNSNDCVGVSPLVWIENLTGIDENKISTLSIFPNPATNLIKIDQLEINSEIEIVELSGKIVKTEKALTAEMEINISELNKGIYFVNVKNGDSISTVKLIKE